MRFRRAVVGYGDDAACVQGDLEEMERLLKRETMALELTLASREKAQAELSKVNLFLYCFIIVLKKNYKSIRDLFNRRHNSPACLPQAFHRCFMLPPSSKVKDDGSFKILHLALTVCWTTLSGNSQTRRGRLTTDDKLAARENVFIGRIKGFL